MSHASLQLDNIYTLLEEVGPAMVVCVNREGGDIVYHNKRFELELATPEVDMSKSTIYDFIHDESYIPLARLLNNANENPNQTAELSFLGKSHHSYEIQLVTHANPHEAQQLFLFLTDIREQQERDRSLAVYQQIFSSTEEIIALIDTNYCYQIVNRAYLEHYQVSEKEIIGSKLLSLNQEGADDLIKVIDRTLHHGEVIHQCHSYANPRSYGEVLYLDSVYSPHYDKQGEICGAIVSARDISEQYRAEQVMESSHSYYKMLFKYSPDMLASVNIDTGKVIESNHMLLKLLELECQEVIGNSVFSFHATACKERLAGAVATLDQNDAISDLELCLISKSGERISVSLRTTPMVDLQQNIAIFVWRDIRQQKQLAHDAIHDPLTALMNRAGFLEQFDKPFRRGEGKTLCYFDVDNFKSLNDSYGHLSGDKFLIELSGLMRDVMPDETIGRMGGDEFVALLCHNDLEVAELSMMELMKNINELVASKVKYAKSQLSVSIGITPFSSDESRQVVLQRADNACYESKRNGKNKVTIYEVQAV